MWIQRKAHVDHEDVMHNTWRYGQEQLCSASSHVFIIKDVINHYITPNRSVYSVWIPIPISSFLSPITVRASANANA